MKVILYNPLSKSGNEEKILKTITKKLKLNSSEFILENVINIGDVDIFLDKYKDIEAFIIFGGDGTLNVLANNIMHKEIKPDILLYASGTGNDFRRSIKKRGKLISIKKYLKDLPKVTFQNQELYFLNGVGLGIDGMVCYKVNNCKKKKSRLNYLRHAIRSFIESKKTDVYINGELHKDAWMVALMNDKYFGGGMKVAPKGNRLNDTLELIIVKRAPKWIVPLIFPTIYLGIHPIFRRYVKIITVKKAEIVFKEPKYLQVDGEDYINVSRLEVKR